MVTVSRRVLLSLLALILVPAVFSVLAPNPTQAGETPSVLLTTATPTERLPPPVTWVDTLTFRLTTYFTKTYPAFDFSPYAQELDRIRGALSLARMIHEASAVSADTRLRRAVSPFSSSIYCTSMPQGLTPPSARLASRLHAFAANLHESCGPGDQWGAKREMGVFLNMLASRAYGLGDDAAEELAVLSQRIMPDEEFGIVYPGSKTEPYTKGGRAGDCNARPNIRGRV